MNAIRKTIGRYSGFALNAIKDTWAYRFRLIIWMVYDIGVLFIQYYLWTAVFANSGGDLRGMGAAQYISYVVTIMIVSRVLACRIDGEIAEQIKDGNISMNLTKPFSFFGMMLGKRMGYTVGDIVSMVPMLVAAAFMTGFHPAAGLAIGWAALSVLLGYILVTVTWFLLGILAFWITNYWGLFLFKQHIIALFSGEVIALDLLFRLGRGGAGELPIPGLSGETAGAILVAFGRISYCLPFQAMAYTPSAILTGMVSGTRDILLHIGLQVLWIAVMGLLAALAWARGLRRVTILGG